MPSDFAAARERTPFRVRPAGAADLPDIVALERSIDQAAHWPEREYAAMLARADEGGVQRHLILAESCATPSPMRVLGYAVAALVRTSQHPIAELENIAVAPAARGQGIGVALCAAVADWCRYESAAAIELEVRAGNTAAIALYRRVGWTPTGRRPNYYHSPTEDAVLMTLLLARADSPGEGAAHAPNLYNQT